jgi:Domain of unknown function (DUF3943)
MASGVFSAIPVDRARARVQSSPALCSRVVSFLGVLALGIALAPASLAEAPARLELPGRLPEPAETAAAAQQREQFELFTPTWHSLGLMTGMRLTEAWLWPKPFAETRGSVLALHYVEAYTHPPKWDSSKPWFEWDGDRWQINAVGHALLGAELYYRPRRCGAPPWLAFGFATLASAVWEYGFEANGVRPSALDLWYTPVSGALLGEARLWGYRSAGHIETRWMRGMVRGILDPFGELERTLGAPC